MDITKISIKRPVAIIMAMFIVVVLGVISVGRMDMALTPEVDMPMAVVMTTYRGAGPEEIESLVTEHIEGALANVENVDSITSTSSEGSSVVTVEFDYGTDIDNAVTNMRDKLSLVETQLPEDADSPVIMKLDMNAAAVLTAVAASESMDDYELKTFIEDTIQPRLERQAGVGSVDILGGAEKEIKVEIDRELMEGLGLSAASIGRVLALENSDQPGGNIDYGEKSLTVSTKLKMESIEDVKKTPIQIANGTVLKLEDIAAVTECDKETTSISRYNGERCISLSVTKASDGNVVSVVKAVEKEIAAIAQDYPEITIEVVSESASVIENGVQTVLSNIFVGAALSVILLFVFLKNVGLTGIIAVSMPLSIIGTFVFLNFSGATINMFSLGGLCVGVGMLVDNSVVVLENIYRYRTSLDYEKIKGTYRAAKEVTASIVASTLTTIVIFIPFLFVNGMVIEMLSDLAYAIVFSLSMSLIASMTVVPMLAGNYVNNMHRNHAPQKLDFINKLLDRFDRSLKRLYEAYGRFLEWAVWHKKRTLCIVLAVFIASLAMVPSIGMELMPASDESKFNVTVKAPKGSRLETVDALSLEMEGLLEGVPEMKSMTVSLSGSSGGMFSGASEESTILCELVNKNDRKRSTEEVMEEIRGMACNIAGADISLSEVSGMSAMLGSGVTVEITGDDIEKLQEISEQVMFQMSRMEGTREISSSVDAQNMQIALRVDKDKIRGYGLTGAEVAQQIRNTVSGYTATTLKTEGTEMDIRIVLPEERTSNMVNIKNMSIAAGGRNIPLSSIADIDMSAVPSSIDRQDKVRCVTVTCDVFGRDSGSVGSEVVSMLERMNLPEGYTARLGGSNEMMEETFTSIGFIIVLAIVFVYVVIAAQFESFLNPLIILFTIPLAFTGAILLLFIAREPISMMALIGCLVLVGIVVNNGIVLIDYIDTLRDRDGLELKEAVLKACPTRLRPILMTAMTTILGQMPVIFSNGESSEVLRGMGLVIAGGLTTSTFLTLVVVPLLYMFFDRVSERLKLKFKWKPRSNPYEVEQECC